ncbi:hypothetical protein C7974DRAFT_473853 [Boeremia exigua]|uniref:uncharacterized protein n=1 Tax=Boeremia exigua TaxID=749465 RepID=UPI001E8E1C40|nr:uncharacterized protein C7974DRAFT_473853 [Boeremia exigua]KAH6620018.1 hypothetical protein C7974DRAFT_473853 [Boeremia exigua]
MDAQLTRNEYVDLNPWNVMGNRGPLRWCSIVFVNDDFHLCACRDGKYLSQALQLILISTYLTTTLRLKPTTTFNSAATLTSIMPYLIGNLLKDIEAGGPITSFAKSFNHPPRLEKEKEAIMIDKRKAKLAKPKEDWVKKKWARYYELNKMGHVKLNFDKMQYPQFAEYINDAQAQGRYRVAPSYLGSRDEPAPVQYKNFPDTELARAANREPRLRKKPGMHAHITKEAADEQDGSDPPGIQKSQCDNEVWWIRRAALYTKHVQENKFHARRYTMTVYRDSRKTEIT